MQARVYGGMTRHVGDTLSPSSREEDEHSAAEPFPAFGCRGVLMHEHGRCTDRLCTWRTFMRSPYDARGGVRGADWIAFHST
jgi:hypothetical protein